VTEEVREIPGVENLETGAFSISSSKPLDRAAVQAAVVEPGYQVV